MTPELAIVGEVGEVGAKEWGGGEPISMGKDRKVLVNSWGGSSGCMLVYRSSGALGVALYGRRDATKFWILCGGAWATFCA